MNYEIALLPETTINNVMQQFRKSYLYLKIEFFSKPHHEHKGSNIKFMCMEKSHTLNHCYGLKNEIKINIPPQLTVWEFENKMQTEHGIFVQVFIKHKNVWLETTLSDGKTLGELNLLGMENEMEVNSINDVPDYHEQD